MSKSVEDLGSERIIVSLVLPAAIILSTILTSTKDGIGLFITIPIIVTNRLYFNR